jgi:hypothetical protein
MDIRLSGVCFGSVGGNQIYYRGSISVWGQDFPGRKKWRILGGRWKSKRKNKEQKDAKPSRTQDKIDANCGSGD